MAAKPADDHHQAPHPPSLPYQTWVLKVSIHCEGCKKKVQKVLKGVEGVYTTVIDSQQHKVTVTCNVEADTLIKKLLRSGKHAELWPVKPEKKEKKSGKSNKNEKQKGQEVGDDDDDDDDNPPETGVEGGEIERAAAEGGGNNGSGGKKKKKKKKKGQNGNSDHSGRGENIGIESAAGSSTADSPVAVGAAASVIDPIPALQHNYPPPMYYYPPHPAPPLYGVSYNTAYPSATASYFAPSMPAYSSYPQLGRYIPPPPSDPIHKKFTDDCPHHDYYYDDDDEGTGCSVM